MTGEKGRVWRGGGGVGMRGVVLLGVVGYNYRAGSIEQYIDMSSNNIFEFNIRVS